MAGVEVAPATGGEVWIKGIAAWLVAKGSCEPKLLKELAFCVGAVWFCAGYAAGKALNELLLLLFVVGAGPNGSNAALLLLFVCTGADEKASNESVAGALDAAGEGPKGSKSLPPEDCPLLEALVAKGS